LVAAVVISGAPIDVRFKLSRAAMTADARAAIARGGTDQALRIGSYRAGWADARGGVLWFYVSGSGLVKRSGFVYSERERTVPPKLDDAIAVRRLDKNWWTITASSW
jgi:hypothetical protein